MERLEEKAEKAISYPDVGRYACGRWAQNLCSMALLLTEFGFALNYFVFIGNTVNALVQAMSAAPSNTTAATLTTLPTSGPNATTMGVTSSYLVSTMDPNSTSPTTAPASSFDINPTYLLIIAAQIPIQIGFSLVRDVRSLGPLSTISNFAILVGYVALLSFFYIGEELFKWPLI